MPGRPCGASRSPPQPFRSSAAWSPSSGSCTRHSSAWTVFRPQRGDLAYDQQVVWNIANGHNFYSSFAHANFLGIHPCKEDQVYTVGLLGLLLASHASPEMRRHGRWVVALAAAWLVVMVGIVQQLIRHGGYSDFVYYQWLLHGPTPEALVRALANPAGWFALLVMIGGMLGLPLLQPRWLVFVLPPMVANLLSHHGPQPMLQLHYALLPMFPVLVAGALGARRWLQSSSPPPLVLAAAALPALILGYSLGSLPPGDRADPRPYSLPTAPRPSCNEPRR